MPTDAELAELEVSIARDLAVDAGAEREVGFTEAMQRRIDALEVALLNGLDAADFTPVECPLKHVFTPGLYSRTISMPRGSIITSRIHKTEHQFVVTKGVVRVFIEGKGWETITAPYIGVTKPMTRRVLLIAEDCTWTTFHATDKQTPEEVEAEILLPRNQHLLNREDHQCRSWPLPQE